MATEKVFKGRYLGYFWCTEMVGGAEGLLLQILLFWVGVAPVVF